MNYQISITKHEDKFLAGIDVDGAYQASADSPLLALRRWIHYVGGGVVQYKTGGITLGQLAAKIGVSEAEAQELAECETLLPPEALAARVRFGEGERN